LLLVAGVSFNVLLSNVKVTMAHNGVDSFTAVIHLCFPFRHWCPLDLEVGNAVVGFILLFDMILGAGL
jgi:hypothetical protein